MMWRTALLVFGLIVGAVAMLTGCGGHSDANADDSSVTSMFVAPEQVDCEGVGPMRCMQVRYSPDEDWQLFYDGIQGFDYQSGYNYELRVRVTPVTDPPADSSSERYELVEVVAKTSA